MTATSKPPMAQQDTKAVAVYAPPGRPAGRKAHRLDDGKGAHGHRDRSSASDVPAPKEGPVVLPASVKGLFKAYKGDLFSSGGNTTEGLLYLSRMNPDADPLLASRSRYAGATQERQADEAVAAVAEADAGEWSAEAENHRASNLRRFAMSLATLSRDVSERRGLVDEGAVRALVTLAAEDDAITKVAVATALRNLTDVVDLRRFVLEAGGAGAVVALSAAPHREIQDHCAAALVNLSMIAGGEALVVGAGGVGALLGMAAASMARMEVILVALCNLSCVEEMYPRLEDMNAAVAHLANFALSERLEVMLVGCLANLSCLKDNQGRLVEEGAVGIVAQLIGRDAAGAEPRAARLCAVALSNLSACTRSRSKMTGAHTVGVLLAMADVDDEHIKQECALTISRLAGDAGCCEKIIAHGALGVVVRMARAARSDPTTGRRCAAALRQLCVTGFLHDLFAPPAFQLQDVMDAVQAVVDLVGQDAATNQNCARTLCALFRQPSLVQAMVAGGALDAVVQLSHAADAVVASWCGRALYSLSRDAATAKRMLRSETCQIALCALCNVSSRAISRRAAATLWNLARADEEADDGVVVVVDGAADKADGAADEKADADAASDSDGDVDYAAVMIPTLISLVSASVVLPQRPPPPQRNRSRSITSIDVMDRLQQRQDLVPGAAALTGGVSGDAPPFAKKDPACAAKAYALGALAQLAGSPRHCAKMLAAGALRPIVDLSRAGDAATKVQCSAILARFSMQAAHLADASAAPLFLDALLDLASLDDFGTQRRFVAGMVNMSYEPASRALMRKKGVLPVLVGLANKPDEAIRRGCAAAICNLAADTGAEQDVLSGKAVPALLIIALVLSDRPETKEICAAALCNVFTDSSTHAAMVEAGAVWALAKLALAKIHGYPGVAYTPEDESTRFVALEDDYDDDYEDDDAEASPPPEKRVETGGDDAKSRLARFYASDSPGPDFSDADVRGAQKLGYAAAQPLAAGGGIDAAVAPVLANLSLTHAAELLALPSVLAALEAMVRQPDSETARPAARCVVNLVRHLPAVLAADKVDGKKANKAPLDGGAVRKALLRATEAMAGDADVARSRLYALCLLSTQCPALLVQRGLRPPVDPSACTSPGAALAYVHLYCNLSQDAATPRAAVADFVGHFHALHAKFGRTAPAVDVEISRCLYYASLHADNAEALVSPRCFAMFAALAAHGSARVRGLVAPLWVTALHNASASDGAQAALVSGGALRLVSNAWNRLDADARNLAAVMACNLATGRVNSARVVSDGGAELIAHLVRAGGADAARHKRCAAAALRNLLRVGANQLCMAKRGAVDALVALASSGDAATTTHCAAALRTLTYNHKTRDLLREAGALPIILADADGGFDAKSFDGGGFAVSHSLLCKVESESWKNGSRAGAQEQRTPLPEAAIVRRCSAAAALAPTLEFKVGGFHLRKRPADVRHDAGQADSQKPVPIDADSDDDGAERDAAAAAHGEDGEARDLMDGPARFMPYAKEELAAHFAQGRGSIELRADMAIPLELRADSEVGADSGGDDADPATHDDGSGGGPAPLNVGLPAVGGTSPKNGDAKHGTSPKSGASPRLGATPRVPGAPPHALGVPRARSAPANPGLPRANPGLPGFVELPRLGSATVGRPRRKNSSLASSASAPHIAPAKRLSRASSRPSIAPYDAVARPGGDAPRASSSGADKTALRRSDSRGVTPKRS
ncbi:armadillo-type protein [Pelagophyceae sp. CCMP2097]|nr:armadillo-type protein [Pelagophyceae sp. CCMP2097]